MKTMSQRFFKKKYQTFLFFFLLANVNALLNFSVIVSTILVEGGKPDILLHTIFELTGSYSFFSLTPLMLILFDKLPLKKEKLWIRIPLYFLAAGCLGVMHTTIMYVSRSLIFDLAGWGAYEYGYFPYRVLMETLKLLLGFWVLFGVYNLLKINKERQAEQLRALQLEEELTKNRLQTLQAQINPHFLFNTLNMISSTMYEDIQSADKMIANLSDLLRISLKNNPEETISLRKEIEILNLYLEIMKERFKNKLEIVLHIDESTNKALVPSFLLQPLVENSIKHGMETLNLLKIEITSIFEKNNLVLSIKDNGPGMKDISKNILNNGIGLSNTYERLQKLYGNNFEFSWENLESGELLMKIVLPLLK